MLALQAEFDVFFDCPPGQEAVVLKNRDVVEAGLGDGLAVDGDRPLADAVETGQDVEQRALATA